MPRCHKLECFVDWDRSFIVDQQSSLATCLIKRIVNVVLDRQVCRGPVVEDNGECLSNIPLKRIYLHASTHRRCQSLELHTLSVLQLVEFLGGYSQSYCVLSVLGVASLDDLHDTTARQYLPIVRILKLGLQVPLDIVVVDVIDRKVLRIEIEECVFVGSYERLLLVEVD